MNAIARPRVRARLEGARRGHCLLRVRMTELANTAQV